MTEVMEEHLRGVSGVLNRLRKMTWFSLRFTDMFFGAVRTAKAEAVPFRCPFIEAWKDSTPPLEKEESIDS